MPDRPAALRLLREHPSPLAFDALDHSAASIKARFEWGLRAGHPGYLWPEVPTHVWRACLFEIERTTARALAGGAGHALDLPEGAAAEALGIAAFTSGMGPLLGHWIERRIVTAQPAVADLLELHLRHSRLRSVRMRAELLRVLDCLSALPGPLVVIKGLHTAAAYFPEPATRPSADVDLVVPPGTFARAGDLLREHGYVAIVGQRRPDKCDWRPPGMTTGLLSLALVHADNPFTIELHESFERVFDGVRRFRLPITAIEPWPELHARAFVQRQPALVVLLALHIGEELHHLQMVRLVELVEMLRRDFHSAGDWADLEAQVGAMGAQRFVYPAFELAERLVPGVVAPEFRRWLTEGTHTRLRNVVEELRPATAQRLDRVSMRERTMWASNWWQLGVRVAYMLWPVRARGSRRPLRRVYRERLYRMLRALRLGGRPRAER